MGKNLPALTLEHLTIRLLDCGDKRLKTVEVHLLLMPMLPAAQSCSLAGS